MIFSSSPSYVLEADPMAEEYEPLSLEDNILVEGADIDGALLDPLDAPIAGGIVVDPTLENDPDADTSAFDQVVEDYIAANSISVGSTAMPTDPDQDPDPTTTTPDPNATPIPDAEITAPTTLPTDATDDEVAAEYLKTLEILEGPRELPTFNCTGLTGYNCCLMIKVSTIASF